jgi:lipopolysaccharide transport system ATP-binding protein
MICFDHVSKRYAIGAATGSLRERLAALPRLALSRTGRGHSTARYHWALRDVSFSASRGEALGIVGQNGAGKTTILKLLSRITKSTEGYVAIDGRVAALIELGAGFHPDLTGYDNVYLYAAILGLTRRQIDSRIQNIIDFAELADFIDTPVKRYSSGMYARLAFAVAAHTDPDTLLVDEVLAVGDRNFQNKCFEFIRSFVNSGKTSVFVSHDLWAMEDLCQRLIWLDQGRVRAIGEPGRVLEQYLSFLEERAAQQLEAPARSGDRLQVLRVRVGGGSWATLPNSVATICRR